MKKPPSILSRLVSGTRVCHLAIPAVLALAALSILVCFLYPSTAGKTKWVADFLRAFPPRQAIDNPKLLADLTSAKLVWLVTGATLTVTASCLGLLALAIAGRIYTRTCGGNRGAFVAASCVIAAVGLGVGIAKDSTGHLWFEQLMVSLHRFEPLMGPDESAASTKAYGMTLGKFTTVANVGIGFASMAVLILSGSLLVPGRPSSALSLAEQARHLDSVPYLGSPVLILGVAEVFALYRYAAYAVVNTDEALELARGVSIAVGLAFSVLLGIAYVAPWLSLRSRVDELFVSAASKDPHVIGRREEWLRENGFSTSYWSGIARLLALLGPALTGTLIEHAHEITGKG